MKIKMIEPKTLVKNIKSIEELVKYIFDNLSEIKKIYKYNIDFLFKTETKEYRININIENEYEIILNYIEIINKEYNRHVEIIDINANFNEKYLLLTLNKNVK